MPALARNNSPRGARFYQDDGKLLFINVMDSCTRDGPRLATEADKEAHPEAWEALVSSAPEMIPGMAPLVTFEGEAPEQVEKRAGRRA